jgi:hypothetical protein
MEFMGYEVATWIDIIIKGGIMWLIIIPAFAILRGAFPKLNIGVLMAVGFFMAIIVSVAVNNMTRNIDFGDKIKGSYDKFLNKINKKIWGETNERKEN